jgi:phosphoribosylformylglycinamidine cyclo-ligase
MAITYRQAGVDIDSGEALVDRIKPLALRTRIPEVVADIGGFAGLCRVPGDVDEPLLVSGTDGVGTKLKVAFATGKHGTIGQDLVAMCVNDIVTCGARPLFFLDYFASGHLDVDVGHAVISGIADGCVLAECALLGGETAELPGMYADGEYDLAGFAVGIVSKKALLGPHRVKPGDQLIGVASSGLHSNGYSLARRVLEQEMKHGWSDRITGLDSTLGEALLTPTRIYTRAVRQLKDAVGEGLHALAHITGGGVTDNLPRVLPSGTKARVKMPEMPAIFRTIQQGGPVELNEMRRTFNLGVGLVVALDPSCEAAASAALAAAGETVFPLGQVLAESSTSEPHVEFV